MEAAAGFGAGFYSPAACDQSGRAPSPPPDALHTSPPGPGRAGKSVAHRPAGASRRFLTRAFVPAGLALDVEDGAPSWLTDQRIVDPCLAAPTRSPSD